MRELEKYYCEYIFLGLPKNPFFYFFSFRLGKGICPTVYSEKTSGLCKLLSLAKFCKPYGNALTESLLRHGANATSKKLTLIVADNSYDCIIEKNKSDLEKYFTIKMSARRQK